MTAKDITPESADREVMAARWERAERQQLAADQASTAACRTRLEAAKAATAETGLRAWELDDHPTVAPLTAAADAAQRVEAASNRALIETPAPDWRAWAVKLDLVRTYLDDVLDAIDHGSRKMIRERPNRFPASRRLLDAHHYALALYARVPGATANGSRVVKLVLQACAELGVVPSPLPEAAVPAFGLAMLAADAERLSAEKGGAA